MSKQKIEATRNGYTQLFDKYTWDILPDHKYGWVQVEQPQYSAPPPVVQAVMQQKEKIKKARKPRKTKA